MPFRQVVIQERANSFGAVIVNWSKKLLLNIVINFDTEECRVKVYFIKLLSGRMPFFGVDDLEFTILQIYISTRNIAELAVSLIHETFLIPLRNKMIIPRFIHYVRRQLFSNV